MKSVVLSLAVALCVMIVDVHAQFGSFGLPPSYGGDQFGAGGFDSYGGDYGGGFAAAESSLGGHDFGGFGSDSLASESSFPGSHFGSGVPDLEKFGSSGLPPGVHHAELGY